MGTGRQGISVLSTNTLSHLQAYTHSGSPSRWILHLCAHHALLTQPEELLNLLGQEKLCAAHSAADLLQDWMEEGESGRGLTLLPPQAPGSPP